MKMVLCARLILFVSMVMFAGGSAAAQPGAGDRPVRTTVLDAAPGQTVVRLDFGACTTTTVMIDGANYLVPRLKGEAGTFEKGLPSVPRVCRSIVIPGDRTVSVEVVAASYRDVEGVRIAPSKGILKRSVDPGAVPYVFDALYGADVWYPGEIAKCAEPFIMRDVRGVTLIVNPVRFNPARKIMRIYDTITVRVAASGRGGANTLAGARPRPSRAFDPLLKGHFINYTGDRYPALDELGELLVIAHDAFAAAVQPLAAWKNSTGIPTTVVAVSAVGNTPTAIGAYIKAFYDTHNLAFVLLVGDADEVATPIIGGCAADPRYALVAGDDNYPDIFVGRFSAETLADAETQIQRTIAYEQSDHTEAWFRKGTGIASDQGPGHNGEYDDEHMGYIRDDLLAAGYTHVDELYAPGVSGMDVGLAINEGRGIVNYCGHGHNAGWVTSGFCIAHVNALSNDHMLPFIFSVACYNGAFDYGTCFAEAWLRSTNGAAPTGAIGMYASSDSQYWDPPMEAQDEFVDRYVDGSFDSFGALCFAGASRMMDRYGTLGRNEFYHWHIFGDPSLRVRAIGAFRLCADANPLQAGQQATFTVENCLPNKSALLAYSITGPGGTPVPWLGLILGLANPARCAGPTPADSAGTVAWVLPVPAAVHGKSVWLQALQYGRVTNVLATSIQ